MPTTQDKLRKLLEAKANPGLATFRVLEDIPNTVKTIAKEIAEREAKRLEERIQKELNVKLSEALTTLEQKNKVSDVFEHIEKIKGEKGNKGEKGDKGERGEKGDKGERGEKGDKGERGERGERGEMGIGINGKDGKNGIDGTPGKNGKDGSPDTGKEIVNKINKNKLIPEEQIDASHIKNLPKGVTARERGLILKGAVNNVKFSDLTSQTDDSTKTFTVPAHTQVIALMGTQFPVIYRPTTDFTTSGTTLTLTSEVSAPRTGQTLVFLYAE